METAGFAMDESTHAIIISSYRVLGPNPTITTEAMEPSLDAHNMLQAMQILSIFDSLSKDDAVCPVHVEDITQRGGELLLPPDQVRPESEPPHPALVPKQDASTFTVLIHHLGKDGDLSRIQQVLEQMQASGVRPDSSTAAALVKSFFVAKQPDTAIQIVADIYPEYHHAQRLLRNLSLGAVTSRKPRILPDSLPVTAKVLNALLQGALGTRGLKGMRVVQRLMHLR
ncbi:hypothetical protein WOLCODRAFT_162417 [Wolfiporia cocos MD-104 SS10]|uniref:Uncharacterized protein n=1 Tax=Wolfiporia cocos (strain MD-104) TaxID=742152 RepID=A0A2H3JF84_WOLCO|nr:hypothetical protein WOLCODRAFT_162417 [Wolfiporia cocos MD-104 SS10]